MKWPTLLLVLLFLPLGVHSQSPDTELTTDPLLDAEPAADITVVRIGEDEKHLVFDVDGALGGINSNEVAVHISFKHAGEETNEHVFVVDHEAIWLFRNDRLTGKQQYGNWEGPGRVDTPASKDGWLVGSKAGESLVDFKIVTTRDPTQVPYAAPTPLDIAPDTGFAADYTLRFDQPATRAGSTIESEWVVIEGPDMAGGASVAVAPDEEIHVAYYVYDDRDVTPGFYHATPLGTWQAIRIADYHGDPEQRDGATRTQIVAGDDVAILFAPDPGSGTGWQLARQSDDWSAVAVMPGVATLDSTRAVPDMVMHDSVVWIAMPLPGNEVAIIHDRDGSFTEIKRFQNAQMPKLDIAPDGTPHVAFLRENGGHPQVDYGDLIWAHGPNWQERTATTDVIDQSNFWPNAGVDGSYDMAITPDGTPSFLWDARTDVKEQFFAQYRDGWYAEPTPLTPIHGNPQLTMRLAFDAAGNAHGAGGYGGLDSYAMRSDGGWIQLSVPRGDVWDMDVSPLGVPALAYTQPHGGTTMSVRILPDGVTGEPNWIPLQKPIRDARSDLASQLENQAPGPSALLLLIGAVLLARRYA